MPTIEVRARLDVPSDAIFDALHDMIVASGATAISPYTSKVSVLYDVDADYNTPGDDILLNELRGKVLGSDYLLWKYWRDSDNVIDISHRASKGVWFIYCQEDSLVENVIVALGAIEVLTKEAIKHGGAIFDINMSYGYMDDFA